MSAIRKNQLDERVKFNLRLTPQELEAIDAVRQGRVGHCSRNTWIAEAIAEKLSREKHPSGGARDA